MSATTSCTTGWASGAAAGARLLVDAEKVLAAQPKATLQLQGQNQPPVMVNVNKATTEELIKIRGIGPVMAKRIGGPRRDRTTSAPPAASLDAHILVSPVLTSTVTLSGVVSDTLSGIDQLEVSFTPLDQVAPLSDAVLWLSFDEQANSAYWEDRSGRGNAASCLASPSRPCSTSGEPGRTASYTVAQKALPWTEIEDAPVAAKLAEVGAEPVDLALEFCGFAVECCAAAVHVLLLR